VDIKFWVGEVHKFKHRSEQSDLAEGRKLLKRNKKPTLFGFLDKLVRVEDSGLGKCVRQR